MEESIDKRDCILSLFCAGVFAFFYLQCEDLMESGAYWPELICQTGMALSLLECVLAGFKWLRAGKTQKGLLPLTASQAKRVLILLAILGLWIWGLRTLGFLVSSLAALCVLTVWFEPEKKTAYVLRDIFVCMVFELVCYYTFKYLGIHFPKALFI